MDAAAFATHARPETSFDDKEAEVSNDKPLMENDVIGAFSVIAFAIVLIMTVESWDMYRANRRITALEKELAALKETALTRK